MKYKGITIFQTPNGKRWYARYRHNGKQHYITAKTQKECYNILKKTINNLDKEKKEIQYYTFKQWYKKWLELFKLNKVKETTLASYNDLLKYINKSFFNRKISDITSIEIIEILNSIKATRQRQKTYEFLKDIFNKAVLTKVIHDNPIAIIDKPKHEQKETKAFTREEQKIFTENCKNNKYGLFYLLCLYQGLRRGECLALTYKDFDIKNKTLSITKSINEKTKQTNVKNKHSIRTMPLFKNTIELIKGFNLKSSERIFNVSTKPLHENFKKILKEIKIRDFKIHELRHTFITRCKERDIPEFIIQKWVGHEIGSKVTSKTYTHLNEDTNLLYYNKLDDM